MSLPEGITEQDVLKLIDGSTLRVREPYELSTAELLDRYDQMKRTFLANSESAQERRLVYMMDALLELIQRGNKL